MKLGTDVFRVLLKFKGKRWKFVNNFIVILDSTDFGQVY